MTTWPGAWIAERAEVRYSGVSTAVDAVDVRSLAGLALRRNQKRLLLIVSTVLGKHIPAAPVDVTGAAHRLGAAVEALGLPSPVLVIGFAETATALGYGVSEMLGDAHYAHSTRAPSRAPLVSFVEEHSHATVHHLAPTDPSIVRAARSIVLVDDEISTGRTSMNIIRSLMGVADCRRFVIACLLDSRPARERGTMKREAAELRVDLTLLALGEVALEIPGSAAGALKPWLEHSFAAELAAGGSLETVPVVWPAGAVLDGQDGFSRADRDRATKAARGIAAGIHTLLEGSPSVLVIGIEEFMAVPHAVASALAVSGLNARVSSTTRSPAAAIDEDGYAIRSVIEFAGDADQGDYPRFLYNVRAAEYDVIVVVAPRRGPFAASRALLKSLAEGSRVLSVQITSPVPLEGPHFSSYPARDVRWLLTDVTDSVPESSGVERELAIQSTHHYSESLPIEYTPDAEYLALFDAALETRSRTVAVAVARLGEQLLVARGESLVLISLARAGTPAGVLVRRWLAAAHGLDVAHYTMSIILDRGLDPVALDYLRAHHEPAGIAFVDGWTGKGSISSELRRSLAGLGARAQGFGPDLGVLADPASTATWAGTHADVLIPSACLNSTVSGLISRTAHSSKFIPEGCFHGARFYAERAREDRSRDFLDSVTAWFSDIAPEELVVPARIAGSRDLVMAELTRLRERYSVDRDALIKPGVCEATRVLLRRVPELLVVREAGLPDAVHLELLAAMRGTPVVVDPDSLFSAVGIIRSLRTK
ncbi:phosphoribosyltransferase [Salinibacterium xinjiangense]|uniref:PELOTA RNA binding domain-containing protein n=1 Tax=Salinibacterium xinjiangense TaxID=386302 RepID=A0A2C8YTG5_9MICO|nr:phosphoribosyltransferase domain-containing protein [Salinibacterium xinjiangense]GGK99865.1 phosphoribosyltransferase [Salinibacterium xinjiangense]SOE53924.1 PELOTA RNA binding domain-containing protein [Salinibacterium xinjiangense]